MLIAVISDTHDHLDRIDLALRRFEREGAEVLIHAGDLVAPFAAKAIQQWPGPIHVVYGNNDGERRGLKNLFPQIEDGAVLVECDGRRISVDHYPPDDEHSPVPDVDVLVFGHTHQVLVEEQRDQLLLNPGECCGWVTGKPTIATLDTSNLNVEIIPVE